MNLINEFEKISINEILINTKNKMPLVLLYMIKNMNKDTNIIITNHRKIAEELGYSHSRIYDYIQRLIKLEYIRKLCDNTYMVNPLIMCDEINDLVKAKYKVFMYGNFDINNIVEKMIKDNMGE